LTTCLITALFFNFCVFPGVPQGQVMNLEEEKEVSLQKRMVDFLKRRVLVLEKVLSAEYHKESLVR
jgi:hypothetical protein